MFRWIKRKLHNFIIYLINSFNHQSASTPIDIKLVQKHL
ncbi:unnamed protein product [Paramecium primaurelia]|uniref:Uncharacterized protein n=1 Tax=Paramecium primaurelia TaxID=5886 RepID=A0A8S1LTG3_PARPR|nr:unnamed protein product [Paramecium primaurelia]